jgi:hypothetical protein
MPQSFVVCPECQRADAVRKVTNIVADGSVMTENYGIGLTNSELIGLMGTSTSCSLLAATLAPPAKPVLSFGYGCAGLFLILRTGLGLFSLMVILVILTLLFPILMPAYRNSPILLFIVIAGIGAFLLLWVRWLIVSFWRDVHRVREMQRRYPSELARWERAVARWKSLYYCSRDDGVFLAHDSFLVPVAQMNDFLYAGSREKQKVDSLNLKLE